MESSRVGAYQSERHQSGLEFTQSKRYQMGWNLLKIKVVSDGLECTQNQSGIRWVGIYSIKKWYQMGWNLLRIKVVSDGLECIQNQSGIRWVGIYSEYQWVRIHSIKSVIREGLRFTESVIRRAGIYSIKVSLVD